MGTRRTERRYGWRCLAVLMLLAMGRGWGQQSIGVLNPHTVVCAIAECQMARPIIGGFDSSSVFSPGGKFVLQGNNFNSADGQPGTIVLKIGNKPGVQITYLGQQGFRQPYVERQSTVLGWAEQHVFGQIPAEISGVMDGPATLEVVRDDGVRSDPYTIKFVAARDLEWLPMSDITVQNCQATADTNLCDGWSDSSQLTIPTNMKLGHPPSVYGRHAYFINEAHYTGGTGDHYTFNLQNQWIYKPYGYEGVPMWTSDSPTNCYPFGMVNPSGPDVINSHSVLQVDWNTPCDIEYYFVIQISGPTGVPWK